MDNKANKELTTFIARILGVPKTLVRIVSGSSSTNKIVVVEPWDASGEVVELMLRKHM